MKTDRIGCDRELLNKYHDRELEAKEAAHVRDHIESCSSCQRMVKENQLLSVLYSDKIASRLTNAELDKLESIVITRLKPHKVSILSRLKNLFVWEKFLIPATVLGAMVLAFFSVTGDRPEIISNPSAIVRSCSGDVSSVMIIETPNSHQTIIWFNENNSRETGHFQL